MKTNPMTPVGIDDGPSLDLGLDLEIGNVRGTREGTGEELVVGRLIGRGNGI